MLDGSSHLIEGREFFHGVDVVLANGKIRSGKSHRSHLGSIGPSANGASRALDPQLLVSLLGQICGDGERPEAVDHVAILLHDLDVVG